MNSNWIIVAIIAGLVSALMFAGLTYPSFFTIFLFYLCPLPLFVAGLSSGVLTAALGGVIASVAIALIAGINPALVFIMIAVIAPVGLSYVALLKRPADSNPGREGEISDGSHIWYPEGRLVIWSAAFAAVVVAGFIAVMGSDLSNFYNAMGQQVDLLLQQAAKDLPADFDPEPSKMLFLAAILPGMAAMWLVMTVINLQLVIRFLSRAEKSLRPFAPFSQWQLPKSAAVGFLASLIATIFPDPFGQAGIIATSLMLTCFVINGLAFMHRVLINNSLKGLFLGLLYGGLMLVGWLLLIPLSGLGLADTLFSLRQKLPAVQADTRQ